MRKITFLFCALFLILSITVSSAQATVYLDEDFESFTTLPPGWRVEGCTYSAYNWKMYYNSNVLAPVFSGKQCLSYDSGFNSYIPEREPGILISPSIYVQDKYATLSFYYRNDQGGNMYLYVSLDNGATYEELLDSNFTHLTVWSKFSYNLSKYIGKNICFVFVSKPTTVSSSVYTIHYLDKIKVYTEPICATPINLSASLITNHSATLSWSLDNEGDMPSAYYISVWDDDDNYIYNNQYYTGSLMQFNLTGLSSNTNYHVTVTGDCHSVSKGNSNPSEVFDFSTQCDGIALPYYHNFDSDVANTMPECWLNLSNSKYTCVNQWTKYGTSGQSFCLIGSSGTSYITTMPIDHEANDLQIDFMMYAYYFAPLEVGLMTDPYDMSTYEPIYSSAVSAGNTWENHRCNTAGSIYGNQKGLVLCFKLNQLNASPSIYIDNLSITAIPNCSRPEEVKVEYSDSASVALYWKSTNATGYQVEINDGLSAIRYELSNTASCVVGSLSSSTTYTFRVRSICSNDTSEWSLPVNETTACGVAPLPLYEDFDALTAMPDCWSTRVTAVAPTATTSAPNWRLYTSIPNPYNSDGRFLMFGGSDGCTSILYTPAVNIPQSGNYEVSFWMYRNQYGFRDTYVAVYVNSKPTLEGAIKLNSITASAECYPIETEGPKFYEYYFDIPLTGTVYVMFEGVLNASTQLMLDKIQVAPKQSCRADIYGLNHSIDLYNNNFTLSWYTKTGETQWLVNTTITDLATSNVVYEVNNALCNDSIYTLNYTLYIQSGKEYQVDCEVRGLCSATDTSIVKEYTFYFTTPCELQSLPLNQNFDGNVFPPLCWSSYTVPTSATAGRTWTRTTTSAHGAGAAQMAVADSITTCYLISPKMTFNAGTNYELSFNMLRKNAGTLKNNEALAVWISASPDDLTNAQRICFIHRELSLSPIEELDGFHNYKYNVNVASSGDYYVVFEGIQEGGSAIVIDDVHMLETPACSTIEIENVIPNPSWYSVDLEIKANSVVEVSVIEANTSVSEDVINSGIRQKFVVNSTNKDFTLAGLNEQTDYLIYVRNVCDSTNNVVSAWSEFSKAFTTTCAPIEVRDSLYLFDGFEDYGSATTISAANVCYEYSSKSLPYIKGSMGTYFTTAGSVCVPFEGAKQMAVNGAQTGFLGYPVHLYPGRNYEVSVYGRIDRVISGISTVKLYLRKFSDVNHTALSADLDASMAQWDKYKAYFTVSEEDDYYVGFEYVQGTLTRYMAFDNFLVKECSCATPTDFQLSGSTYNSASFVMQNSGNEVEVRICTTQPAFGDDNPTAVITETVNSANFTINGLTPNTQYYAVVRSICQGETSEWSKPIAFRSECYYKNLPYSTSFEEIDELNCWSKLADASSECVIVSSKSRYGNNSLKLKSVSAISPEMNVTSIGNCMISGWVYADQATPTTVNVGVIVDKYDVSTFEIITSFSVEKSNEWVKFTAYLNDLNDPDYEDFVNAHYFVLECTDNATYYFDELEVNIIPSCPKTSIVNTSIVNATDVQVSWPIISNESIWRVSVNQMYDASESTLFDTIVNSNSCIFHQLPSLATYRFGVTTICSAEDESDTVYSDPMQAPCIPTRLPYVSKFGKEAPDCWQMTANTANSTRNWMYDAEGYFYSYPYVGNITDTAWLEMPHFELKTNNGIIVKLDGFIQSSFDTIPVRLEYSVNGSAYTTTSTACLSHNSRGETIVFIPQVGAGTIALRLVSERHAYCNLYLYGVEVTEVENCTAPTGVDYAINNDAVTVTITDADDNSWEYVYEQGEFNPDYRTPIATQSKTISLGTLPLSTVYNLYVRTNCGNEKSAWYGPVLIKTRCLEALPYTEDFDNLNYNFDVLKECYYIVSENANDVDGQDDIITPYVDVNAVTGALSMTSSAEYAISLVLPEFESAPNTLELTFNYKNEGTDAYNTPLVVGIVNTTDMSTFIPVQECPLTAVMSEMTVDFTKTLSASGNYAGYHIAFKYGAGEYDGFYVTIDNIRVKQSEKCSYNPEISLYSLTTTTATLDAVFNADTLQVSYVSLGMPASESTMQSFTTHRITLDNLTQGNIYDIYVRNVCHGVPGEWEGPLTVATNCGVITITDETPWIEEFTADVDPLYPFPACMTRVESTTQNGTIYPMINTSRVLDMKGDNLIALPQFNNNPTSYRMVVYVSGYGKMSVGSVSNTNLKGYVAAEEYNVTSAIKKIDIDLSAYSISGERIAIKAMPTSDFVIHKIEVYNLTSCYEPRILDVIPSDVKTEVNFNMPTSATGLNYRLISSTDTITNTLSIVPAKVELNNLTPDADYQLEIRTICGSDTSDYSVLNFRTLCSPISVSATAPYFEGFEGATSGADFATTYSCWQYEQNEGYTAMKALTTATSDVASIAFAGSQAMTLPYTNKATITNRFDMATGTYELSLYAVQSKAQGYITVRIRAQGATTWAEVENQVIRDFYEPVSVKIDITEAGVYELQMEVDATQADAGNITIDNISLRAASVILPSKLDVINITSTTADVVWKAIADTHRVVVEDANGDTIQESTVTSNTSTLHLTDLQLAETYQVTLTAVGSDNITTTPVSVMFTTVCDILSKYHNDFDSYADYERPSCWEVESFKKTGAYYVMAENAIQWRVKNVANHRGMFLKNSAMEANSYHNLYSPEFNITENMTLNFDCYNNVKSSHSDSLVVTIMTGEVESAPIAVITSEVANGKWYQFGYNLREYEGQTIRVKFSTRSNSVSTENMYVGIDNFSISQQVRGASYETTLCENEDYTENGFNVLSSQLVQGAVNNVSRIAYGAGEASDTLYTASIFVPTHDYTEIYDTICAGDVYSKGLFSNLTQGGRYIQKTASYYQCDSSVILHLTVFNYNDIFNINICEGDVYPFGDTNLSQSGVYTDTLVSSWGCDSIVTIILTVSQREYEHSEVLCEGNVYRWNDTLLTTAGRHVRHFINKYGCDSIEIMNLSYIPSEVNASVEMCSGQTYNFGGNEISEAGEYTHTFVNSLGCDSTVHLTVTVIPAPVGKFEDYTCEGQGYYNYGFIIDNITSDTILTRTISRMDGCDSIIEVSVDFIPTAVEYITATIQPGETYEFAGNTYTQAGTYTGRFYTELGCDSIIYLTLIVTTSVENAYALPIVVAPNPIYGGQSTFVSREWTVAEQSGMRVEVLNAVGQIVEIFTPTTFPIEVGGIYTSGVYYIRITTGTGDIYLGRLVVR